MKRWIALLLAAVMVMSLAACGGKQSADAVPTWVTYETTEGSEKNDLNRDIFIYSYQQPVLSGSSDALHMINTKLGDATTSFLYGGGGVAEMTEQAKRDWKEPWFNCYALDRQVRVARLDEAVASFRYSDYVFNGGVHGYTAEYGVSYDMVSGQQLGFEDLADNAAGLKSVCLQHITAYLAGDAFPHKEGLVQDYESYLDTVLENWVLTEEGLQFIAQPYIISTYALGTLRFTVPYEKIAHILDKKWMPVKQGKGGGTVELRQLSDQSALDGSFVIDAGGEQTVVKINGTVYDFSVERLTVYPAENRLHFAVDEQLLYSPMLASKAVGLQIAVPEGIPSVMLRYRDGDGQEYQYLIGYDGKNGGAALTEPEEYIPQYE